MLTADLHLHSKYSLNAGADCVPEVLDLWARYKGLSLLGTGDLTHPAWRAELSEALVETEEGLYTLRPDRVHPRAPGGGPAPRFVVSGTISSIYKKDGKVRKVHNLILLPSLEAAEALSHRLEDLGCNIHSDGRPILGLDCRDLLELTLETAPNAVFIPAHIWTPHFSLFGAASGFDRIEDCFGDLTPHIHALETGLSSDPPMNWRWSALDRFQLLSNSDAHSPADLGREADLLDIPLSYPALEKALRTGRGLKGTLEFYPQAGKHYHDGHRACRQCLTPAEAQARGGLCPVCGKPLTPGVLHRLEQLADRPEGYVRPRAPKFEHLAPLSEVVSATLGFGPDTKRNQQRCEELRSALGSELFILRQAPLEDVEQAAGPLFAEGLRRLRAGEVRWTPGCDGAYGTMELLTPQEKAAPSHQVSLFSGEAQPVPAGPAAPQSAPAEPEVLPPVTPEGLDPDQRSAARYPGRALLLTAPKGTGKTRTLFSRVLWLLEDQGERPSEIAILTHTERSAALLRERLEAHLGDRRFLRGMTIGTFHSVALELLTKDEVPLRLAGPCETLDLARRTLAALGVEASPQALLAAVSRQKNGDPDPRLAGACDFYARRLREQGLMDRDDLLLLTLEAWEDKSRTDARKFRHILADEVQTCTDLQYRLLKAWNRLGYSLFLTGTAAPRQLTGEDFPELTRRTLTRSYRSPAPVLACARHLDPVLPDTLLPRPGGREKVRLLTAENGAEARSFLLRDLARLTTGRHPLPWSRIGILCSDPGAIPALEADLLKADIPTLTVGRGAFLPDALVRGVLCFFQLLLDPEDTLALEACLRLVWGLSPELARAVGETWRRRSGPAAQRIPAVRDAYAPVEALAPWLDLTAFFGQLADWAKPDLLLERWSQQSGLTSPALHQLQETAAFYRTMPDLLQGLALGEERDFRRSDTGTEEAVTLAPLTAAEGMEFTQLYLLLAPGEERDHLLAGGASCAAGPLTLLVTGEAAPLLSRLPAGALEVGSAAPQGRSTTQISLF